MSVLNKGIIGFIVKVVFSYNKLHNISVLHTK